MNGSAIIAAVRTGTMVPTSQVSDDELLVWVNEGYYRVAALHPWPWLEALANMSTAVGAPSYPLSGIGTGLRRIVAVYDSENRYRLRQYDTNVALDVFGDYAFTELASTITEPIVAAGATTMTLADASLYSDLVGHVPTAADPIYLRFAVGGEIVRCTDFTGEVATIERGMFGTTAATQLDNAVVYYAPTDRMGHPTGFFIWGSSLYLNPVPDSVIPLRVVYHKVPTVLTAGSAPEFDPIFHHALVHYGEFRVWQREEDLDKASAAYAHYSDIVERMGGWYTERIDSTPWQVGVPPWSGSALTNTPFLDGL